MAQRGYTQISFEVLGELLRLPKGCIVKGIHRDTEDHYCGSFKVLLEGTGLPEVPDNEWSPQVDIQLTTKQVSYVEFAGFSHCMAQVIKTRKKKRRNILTSTIQAVGGWLSRGIVKK